MSNEIKVIVSDANKIITKVNWLSSNDYTSAEKNKVANVPNDTNAVLALKSNKAQEAWITPTLLNGYTQATPNVQYRKDQFGKIVFRGRLSGIFYGLPAFVLPVGYRPTATFFLSVTIVNSSAETIVEISTNGEVKFRGRDSVTSGFDGIKSMETVHFTND